MTQAATKTSDNDDEDGGSAFIEADQYNFWGLNSPDPWDALHAHFEREAGKNGSYVEESTTTGQAVPSR